MFHLKHCREAELFLQGLTSWSISLFSVSVCVFNLLKLLMKASRQNDPRERADLPDGGALRETSNHRLKVRPVLEGHSCGRRRCWTPVCGTSSVCDGGVDLQ